MNKNIFKSYNYSLFTNYKKENIRKMIDSLTYGEDMLEMSIQDVLSLLVIDQDDTSKKEMSWDDIYTFLRYVGLDSLINEKNVVLALPKVSPSKLSDVRLYDSSELMEMLQLLAKKRVNYRFNAANVMLLSSLFEDYNDFDMDVVIQLLYGQDEDYELYKRDKYLVLNAMEHESKIAMDDFLHHLKYVKTSKPSVASNVYVDFEEPSENYAIWNDTAVEDDHDVYDFRDSEDTYQYRHHHMR